MSDPVFHVHLHGGGTYTISIRLEDESMAGQVDTIKAMLTTLTQKVDLIMPAIDDLKSGVDEAVAAMTHAANTIQQNAAGNTAMEQAATRLHEAAAALSAIDPAEAVAEAASSDGSTSGESTDTPADADSNTTPQP